jgi:hypothetical protein
VIDENGDPIRDPTKNIKIVKLGATPSVWCTTSPQLKGEVSSGLAYPYRSDNVLLPEFKNRSDATRRNR